MEIVTLPVLMNCMLFCWRRSPLILSRRTSTRRFMRNSPTPALTALRRKLADLRAVHWLWWSSEQDSQTRVLHTLCFISKWLSDHISVCCEVFIGVWDSDKCVTFVYFIVFNKTQTLQALSFLNVHTVCVKKSVRQLWAQWTSEKASIFVTKINHL